ncbi:Squalene/phytoene synthase [Geopyxis carbonaria]|nr:Squalene/phytoene synthase [Geopyxis carbonaria]
MPPLPLATARTACAATLRRLDHASHLQTPFLPPAARDAHLALRTLNIETAGIDGSANAALAAIRFQFWRDEVDRVFATPTATAPAEPTLTLLAASRGSGAGLSRSFIQKLLTARATYSDGRAFETLDALEAYAEACYGSLQYLALESVGARSTVLDHIGSHVGKAVGLAAVLRGVAVMAGERRVVLPLDVCADVGMRQEDVIRRGPAAEGLQEVVFRVATRANDHLITARKMVREAGAEAKAGAVWATFLQAVPTNVYLEGLEKADFDPFAVQLQKKAWTLPWRMYRASATKTF